jgi:hypothetical protein
MLASLVALLVWFAGVIFTIYILERYFPNLPAMVRAALAAVVTLVIIRALDRWLCSWLCAP